jgi:hypothetical protein
MAVVMARKKHSARKGSRAMKRDAAPLSAIRRDEIVEEIVDHLRPLKNHKSFDTVKAAVNHKLGGLLEEVPRQMKLFDRRVYREHAKKLDKAISIVEKLLASSPLTLRWFLFNPTLRLSFVAPRSNKSIEEIMREDNTRIDAFVTELKRLRNACAREIGPHPNYGLAKHLSAAFAYDLMQELSDREITGTKYNAFRNITSLLYEAVSGEQAADLKRACDAVISDRRYPHLSELGTDRSS